MRWRSSWPRLAGDAAAAARFEREARITAALAHPNVIALYDVGVHDGTPYLVEELLTGETLRARLHGGAVPARKGVEWMRQVTLGLAAAHARELVHRDVKPENIFLTADGHVKLLDFGLAKTATGPAASATTAAQAATGTGDAVTSGQVVLGTVAYMSPEQVRGQALDHRSDIFSVGVVLYELLTGRRPFDRATAADTMSAILTAEAPALEPASDAAIPPALDRLVRRCLEKAPAERFQSTRDLAFALETAVNDSGATSGVHRAEPTSGRWPIAWRVAAAVTGLAGLGVAFTAGRATTPTAAPPRVTTRLQLTADGRLSSQTGRALAVSHDGRMLALAVTGHDGIRRLHARRFDEDVMQPVPETEGASAPFFSPDDRSLGFIVGGEVRQVTLGSGRPSLVWRSLVTNTLNIGNVDWYGPATFMISPGARALVEIRTPGSPPVVREALRKGEFGHLFAQVLPGAAQVLYVSYPLSDTPADANMMVQPLEGGEPRVVVQGSTFGRLFGRYLVYESNGSIFAARADATRVVPGGPAVKVITSIDPRPGYTVAFGGAGTLAHVDGDFPPARQFNGSTRGARRRSPLRRSKCWSTRSHRRRDDRHHGWHPRALPGAGRSQERHDDPVDDRRAHARAAVHP